MSLSYTLYPLLESVPHIIKEKKVVLQICGAKTRPTNVSSYARAFTRHNQTPAPAASAGRDSYALTVATHRYLICLFPSNTPR